MGNFIKTQSSFANGEVSPNFFASDNIHGLAYMENMDVIPGGGIARRAGLKTIATLTSNARLVSFSLSENNDYVLALMNAKMRIFKNGTMVQNLVTPWAYADLPLVQYAQRFGTMIFVHPDYKPQILSYENGVFKLTEFLFSYNDAYDNIYMPFIRFEDSENITITVTHVTGGEKLTTNHDFWTQDNVNGQLSLLGKTFTVLSYIDAQNVIAVCNGVFTYPDDPVTDWKEAVFSYRRGWPISITFHQNRLVFGGAKSWPGGVWMSCVGQHMNFNTGTGLDDEAIFFTLLSDRRQHICTLRSSDNLQILTSEGEWAVSNKPLTPESVDIKMHTSVGSPSDIYLAPQEIEGKTVFVSKSKKDIRELALDELGQNYNANNLCDMSAHLMHSPIDIAYNKTNKRLFVVMNDGNMAVLNRDSSIGISAWGRYTTKGKFYSVTVCDTDTFVVTKRGDSFYLEQFVDSEMMDATNNKYTVRAVGIPLRSSGHNARKVQIRKIVTRLHNSKTIFINNWRAELPNEIYADGADGYSGDVSLNTIGTCRPMIDAPWEISTTDAMPITVLGITIYGRYQI
ncbi:MAG: hypothetical protein J5613_00290 [Alphaproteobacteria bacterium]|nr:hypothetical protein [Alphaproteobacteria bacterium]